MARRTREWWARLTKEERSELVYLERGANYWGRSAYLPDDCSECGGCGNPQLGSGLCERCNSRLIKLLKKANADSEPTSALRVAVVSQQMKRYLKSLADGEVT